MQLLAALVELKWVLNAMPLMAAPKPAWIQSALLGVNLSSLRSEYFSALQQMAQQSSQEAEGGGAEVRMHTVQIGLQRTPSDPTPGPDYSVQMSERDVTAPAASPGALSALDTTGSSPGGAVVGEGQEERESGSGATPEAGPGPAGAVAARCGEAGSGGDDAGGDVQSGDGARGPAHGSAEPGGRGDGGT